MARVIDIQRSSYSGCVQATAKASGFYGIFILVPIIIPAFTESDACKSFGNAVAKFVLGEEIGEQPERKDWEEHPPMKNTEPEGKVNSTTNTDSGTNPDMRKDEE
jgi:hypothetical protein